MDFWFIFVEIPIVWVLTFVIMTIIGCAICWIVHWTTVLFGPKPREHRAVYYTPWGEEIGFGDWHRVQYYYNGDWSRFAPERYHQNINWQREGF